MTTVELKQMLDEMDVSSDAYSLDGSFLPDRMILFHRNEEWVVVYCDERGRENNFRTFSSEKAACLYLYNYYKLR